MLDSDSDGLISAKDLEIMLGNLGQQQIKGKNDVDKFMETALNDGGMINFTQFLTMFGEHLAEVSLEEGSEEKEETDRERMRWLETTPAWRWRQVKG